MSKMKETDVEVVESLGKKQFRIATIHKETTRQRALDHEPDWHLPGLVDREIPSVFASCVARIAKDLLDILDVPSPQLLELVEHVELEPLDWHTDHIPSVLVGLGLLKGIALGLQISVEDMLTMAGVIHIGRWPPKDHDQEEWGTIRGAIEIRRKSLREPLKDQDED